jgi:hypothetical protein
MLIVFVAAPAHGCSCMPANPEQMLEFGPVAFVGTVVGVNPGADRHVVSFEVDTVLAGDLTGKVDVLSPPGGGAGCGIEVPVGNRVAVFATDEGGGLLSSNLCSITDADIAIAALGPGTPPTDSASPAAFDWQIVWLAAGAAGVVAGAWLLTRRGRRSQS